MMPRYEKDKNLIPTGSLVEIKYEDLERSFEVLALIQRGSTSPTLEGLPIKAVGGDLLERRWLCQ
jgi:hypothetical protein